MSLPPPPPRAWALLTDRSGAHILDPTEAQRAAVLHDLFHGARGEEPVECALEYGQDGASVLHVAFTEDREAHLEEWVSHGADTELKLVREATDVSDLEALLLWRHLAAGDVEMIRTWRWRAV